MSFFLFSLALLFLVGAFVLQALGRFLHLPAALCVAAGILACSAGVVEWVAYNDPTMGATYAAIGVVYLVLSKQHPWIK